MGKKVNIQVKATGTEQVKRDVKELSREYQKAGQKIEQAGGRAGKASSGFGKLGEKVSAVKGKILGIIGAITSLIAVLKIWAEHNKKVKDSQDEIVESTKSLDQAAKALASQANVAGTEAGQKKAREQILKIQTAGNLSFELAQAVSVSAHSAFGTSGQLFTDDQLGIASAVGGFAQRKDISSSGVDQLFKVLSAFGVENQQQAEHRIQQLSTVQQASKAKSFEEFITGGVKSLIPALAQRASPEFALASFASSLDVSASSDIAAEQTKQTTSLLQIPKVAIAVAASAGIDELTFRNLPFDQRKQLLSGFISQRVGSGAGQKELLDIGISPERLGVVSTLFNQPQLQRRSFFQDLAVGSTGEQFRAEAEGFSRSTQGRIEKLKAQRVRKEAEATDNQRIGNQLIKLGEQEFKNRKARNEEDFLIPDSLEEQTFGVYGPLVNRANALSKKVPASGRQKLQTARERLRSISPSLTDPMTAGEVGEVDTLLRELEDEYGGNPDSPTLDASNSTLDTFATPPPTSTQSTTIIDQSSNIIYHRPEGSASPRVGPDDN